jgi:multisubunit Na+/H+ antiporter MnhB subunit
MELTISVIVGFMILGAIYAIHARDILSAVIAGGIVGYSLVICFLLIKAPDLAIVQIVVETITLIIMIAVVLDSSRTEAYGRFDNQAYATAGAALVILLVLFWLFRYASAPLDHFGEGTLRMSDAYINGAVEKTGSVNLVTGVIFDFRGYDTLGEATVLVTAVLGVLTILRIRGRK